MIPPGGDVEESGGGRVQKGDGGGSLQNWGDWVEEKSPPRRKQEAFRGREEMEDEDNPRAQSFRVSWQAGVTVLLRRIRAGLKPGAYIGHYFAGAAVSLGVAR